VSPEHVQWTVVRFSCVLQPQNYDRRELSGIWKLGIIYCIQSMVLFCIDLLTSLLPSTHYAERHRQKHT
jgi:hypothetical protein